MTAAEFMEGATVEPLGADWGKVPLWRFTNGDRSVDVHGADETKARAAALKALAAEETVAP